MRPVCVASEACSPPPKQGGASGSSIDGPLTLLPVVIKLFVRILSESFTRAIRLHDQQFAFRPCGGTLNL